MISLSCYWIGDEAEEERWTLFWSPVEDNRRQILCSSTFERQAPRALHTVTPNRHDPLVRSRTGSMGVVIFGAEQTCCVVNRP